MKFIGLRLCEHDSNISYSNGIKVKYYKSERDLQIKHHGYNDLNQWTKIIKRWGINPKEVNAICIVLDCYRYPYLRCNEKNLYEIIDIPLFKSMGFECPIFRVDHHYAHLLSTWTLGVNSDFGFVFDGFGDDLITHSVFKNNKRVIEYRNDKYQSLGLILSEVGNILELHGDPLDHAGKVMALKGYGTATAYDKIINLKNLNQLWDFKYLISIKNNPKKVCEYLSTCHAYTEKIYTDHFKNYSKKNDIIFYSGGIAQNTIINSAIKKERPNLQIPPHCNDEGLSLGAIEFLRNYYNQEKFDCSGYPYWQDDEVPQNLPSHKTIKEAAERLAKGNIVGLYQGKGEIGSRALGNRSILMNPVISNGKDKLNQKVKHREWFRPFGATILENKVSEYFDWNEPSPYMLYVMNIIDTNSFPSITHVDGTCRIQTVSSQQNEIYYSLICEFEKLTGLPMLLNTSLNNGGKPICGFINDALELLESTELDSLVIGDDIYSK
jgi:carbamoyltransferase